MHISEEEAAAALNQVDRTIARSELARAYRASAPYLMLWGVIWALGYAAMGLTPMLRWSGVWAVLDLAGVAVTAWLMTRRGLKGRANLRPALIAVAILAFIFASLWVFQPAPIAAVLVFPAMICGLVYIVAGTFRMPRLAWVGLAIAVAAVAGFGLRLPWLTFWIAGVGGGGLFLGGYWMRQA